MRARETETERERAGGGGGGVGAGWKQTIRASAVSIQYTTMSRKLKITGR